MLREATRYAGVQVLAYGIDYGVFALVLAFGGAPLPGNVAGKVAAGVAAFALHRLVTFKARDGAIGGQAVRYAGLLLLNLPLSSAALYLALFALPPYVAKVAADVACVGITFLLTRHLVFRRRAR